MENKPELRFEVQKCILVKEQEVSYSKNFTATNPEEAVAVARKMGFADFAEEHLSIFCLNTKGRIIAFHEVSHGSINESLCCPRDIFKRALLNNAVAIIVMHNHPSGDPTPSETDRTSTEKLVESGKILGVKVLDHIILAEDGFYSFKENDLI